MRSGRVRRRARPLGRTWARVLREAGARVQENVLLRNMSLPGISPADGRVLEIVATGLPLFRGVPLGVDVTLVSPLHADGEPWAHADTVSGVAVRRGEHSKDVTYPELVESDVVRLTTLACEVGGRWGPASADFIAGLAAARARASPKFLQLSARLAFERRWWALLSCAQQDALAATLVDDAVPLLDGHDGEPVSAAEVVLGEAFGFSACGA